MGLVDFFNNSFWRESGTPITATWRAKLFRREWLFFFENVTLLVLASCSRAVLAWRVGREGLNQWSLDMRSKDCVVWHFPINVARYLTTTVRAAWKRGVGLVFEASETVPPLNRSLLHRTPLTKAQLLDLHADARTGIATRGLTATELREALVRHVFEGRDDLVAECLATVSDDQAGATMNEQTEEQLGWGYLEETFCMMPTMPASSRSSLLQ